jgi:hypothetical protein
LKFGPLAILIEPRESSPFGLGCLSICRTPIMPPESRTGDSTEKFVPWRLVPAAMAEGLVLSFVGETLLLLWALSVHRASVVDPSGGSRKATCATKSVVALLKRARNVPQHSERIRTSA